MTGKRIRSYILLCGFIICTWAPWCHGQDIDKLLDVKKPQQKDSPTLMQESVAPPAKVPVQTEKPDEEASGKSWYRRLLEGMATSFAIINTEKQGDGRPFAPGKSQ